MAHRRGEVEEDSATLQLGPDFKTAKCLNNADVALILEHKRELYAEKGIAPKSDFLKAYHYVNTVKQFKDRDVVMQVRKELQAYNLAPFEVTQLSNLCPENAQEAKALIASLDMPDRECGEIGNSELNEVLQQLASYKQFST